MSARAQALRDQVNRYASRRVLRPTSLGGRAESIQRQVLTAEIANMRNQYNAGLVSNEEFKSFLEKVQKNSSLNPSEIVSIQKDLILFEQRIMGDQLQTAYAQAQGRDKAQAAYDLSVFYDSMATNLQEGTPAQQEALQASATWNSRANSEIESYQKEERRLARSTAMLRLSEQLLDPNINDIDKIYSRAEEFRMLAQMASEDGQENEAMTYMTRANTELAKVDDVIIKANRTERLNFYRSMRNDYAEGKISAQEMAGAMASLKDAALEADDLTLVTTINEFANSLQKDIEKGVERGTINGLSYSIRRSGKQETVGVDGLKEAFREEDDRYRDELRAIERIPDAAERLEKLIELRASYLYGAGATEYSPDGWLGLQQRQEIYSQWAELFPSYRATYENNARDTASKLDGLLPKLAQEAAQFDALGFGPEITEAILKPVMDKLPESLTPGPGGAPTGIMIERDNLGREYEKVIPLNTTVSTTDPVTGQVTNMDTKVGLNIAPIIDPETGQTKYLKLNPYFSDPAFASSDYGMADLLYGTYKGEMYAMRPYGQEMRLAKELALEDDNASKLLQSHPPTMEEQRQGQIQEQVRRNIEQQSTKQGLTTFIGPLPPKEEAMRAVQAPPRELQDYTLPVISPTERPMTMPSKEAYGLKTDTHQDIKLPANYNYSTPLPASQPIQLQPTNYSVAQNNQIANQLTLPQPSPIAQSGIKINLDSSYAPPLPSQKPKEDNFLVKAAKGIGSFIGKLNPFK